MMDIEEANAFTHGEECKAASRRGAPHVLEWNIVDLSVGQGSDKKRILSNLAVSGPKT
jgi:hypothetical protein